MRCNAEIDIRQSPFDLQVSGTEQAFFAYFPSTQPCSHATPTVADFRFVNKYCRHRKHYVYLFVAIVFKKVGIIMASVSWRS